MNITEKVAEDLESDKLKQTVLDNAEIQIYAWTDGYAWRDSRFKETADEYSQRGLYYEDMINQLEKHLTNNL